MQHGIVTKSTSWNHQSTQEREHRLLKEVHIGDSVWALHGGGCSWLPGIVENFSADHLTYNIRYPLSQIQLRGLRKQAKGSNILSGKVVHAAKAISRVHEDIHPSSLNKKLPSVSENKASNSEIVEAVLSKVDNVEVRHALNCIFKYNSE